MANSLRSLGSIAALVAALGSAGCSGDEQPGPGSSTTAQGGAGGAGGEGGAAQGGGGNAEGGNAQAGGGAEGGASPSAGCGNGLVEAPEQCDDKNVTADDGCESDCKRRVPVCGNAEVEAGELCDNTAVALCTASCTFPPGGTCAAATNLNDPTVVIQAAGVTTYSSTTAGSSLKGFGTSTCTSKVLGPERLHRFTAPATGAYTIETVASVGLTDTVLRAYADCLDPATALGCSDDKGAADSFSGFAVQLPKDVTVYFVVSGVGSGGYQLKITQHAACGDGVWAPAFGELCDDGNILDADGCSSTCTNELIVAEQEPNDTAATASTYSSDTLATVDPSGDVDYFTLTVPQGESKLIATAYPVFGGSCEEANWSSATLGAVNADLTLFSADGMNVLDSSDPYLPCPVIKSSILTPGNYLLRVRANATLCATCRFEYGLYVAYE